MALSAPKKIVRMVNDPSYLKGPLDVAASAVIYHGALVGLVGGYAKAAAGTDDTIVGIANLSKWDDKSNVQGISFAAAGLPGTTGNVVDNTGGSNGDRQIYVEVGVFKLAGKSGDAPVATDIDADVYVEDDASVKMTAAGAVAAGKLIRLDDDGQPFVRVGF
jgi:hypothetical protein